jgi:hypothetical protein
MSATAEKPAWFPDLLKSPRRDLLDTAQLERSVENGGAIFFLGAGASSLRPSDGVKIQGPWKSVGSSLRALYDNFTSQDEKNPEQNFLRCFAASYRVNVFDIGPSATNEKQDDDIVQLQLSLVKLVVNLTRIFGLRMTEGCICISSPQVSSIQAIEKLGESLQIPIVDTLVAAYKLSVQDRKRFDAQNIWTKLVHFAYEHTDETSWIKICDGLAKEMVLEKIVNRLKGRQFDFKKRGSGLTLSEIAWLTQLLWYSFIYNVPAYPTTSELAFRLSLLSRNVPPRVGELAQAAETIANYKTLVENVSELFEFCDSGLDKKYDELHLAVAAALGFAFESYDEIAKRISAESKTLSVYNHSQQLPPPPPMALTTNFDLALERAFDSLKISYHTVFPVFARQNLGGDSVSEWAQSDPVVPSSEREDREDRRSLRLPEIVWVVKTVQFYKRDKSVDWELWSEKLEIKGPIIVKLHGSPVESIPKNKLLTYRDHYPCVVLPESTYLEMTLQYASPFSIWLSNGLKTPKQEKERSLWFLGYSVSDWNVRLRLYEQLQWVFELTATELPELFAINREFDRYQSAVFGRLRVVQREADLQMIADAILSMDEIKNYLSRRDR